MKHTRIHKKNYHAKLKHAEKNITLMILKIEHNNGMSKVNEEAD